MPTVSITPARFDACLFDLDGVVTKTARLYAAAWKKMFDAFLRRRAAADGQAVALFDEASDYARFVDGKPRFDGVRSFLASRGIDLPEGDPGDAPGDDTVCALGNRKNALVLELLEKRGIEAYDDTVAVLRAVRARGLGAPVFQPGTYVNGFFESRPIVYGERAYGYPDESQTILNLTDGKIIRLAIAGEPFDVRTGELRRHERVLDLRTGVLRREVEWVSPGGVRALIGSRRFVSLHRPELACIEYEVTLPDVDRSLEIVSELRPNRSEQLNEHDPREAAPLHGRVLRPRSSEAEARRVLLVHTTRRSRLTIACEIDHHVETECPYTEDAQHGNEHGTVSFRVQARAGATVRLWKLLVYEAVDRRVTAANATARVRQGLDDAMASGWARLLDEHRRHLHEFWRRADVVVDGAPDLQQALRYSAFSMLQASYRADGRGLPAKGLTGQGYEGHTFWDSESFVQPFLTYVLPEQARAALRFRYKTLDRARERARVCAQRGAMFPWRTIDDDVERNVRDSPSVPGCRPAGPASRSASHTGDASSGRGPGRSRDLHAARGRRARAPALGRAAGRRERQPPGRADPEPLIGGDDSSLDKTGRIRRTSRSRDCGWSR